MNKLKIYLLSPRGFCFGVSRALNLLDKVLETEIPFVYHPIIHNKNVIKLYEEKGVKFVSSLDEVPDGACLFFSAHGTGQDIRDKAKEKNLRVIDGSCPFVLKVHQQLKEIINKKLTPVIIGKKGHDEILGLTGEIPVSYPYYIIENENEIDSLPKNTDYGYVTQTTLEQTDTKKTEDKLKKHLEDHLKICHTGICTASEQRQNIVRKSVSYYDALFVIGDMTSSNSHKLVQSGIKAGLSNCFLIENPQDIDSYWKDEFKTIAVTTSASARSEEISRLFDYLSKKFILETEELSFKDDSPVMTPFSLSQK